jgi:hypothetical protein
MATTIDPSTAIRKKVDVSVKDGKSFSENVFFLEIWSTGNVTSEKTIEVKNDGKKLAGAFKLIQFKFDKNNNYIYTSSDINQKATYTGTASEFSISGLSAGNANTVIRIGKTNSPNDVIEQYNGPAELVKVKVEQNSISELASKLKKGFWSSEESWKSNRPVIKEDGPDPLDKRLEIQQLEGGEVRISGDGIAEIDGKLRLYIFKKDKQSALDKKTECLWEPNLEVSCEIKVDEVVSEEDEKKFFNIGGCTNHFTDDAGLDFSKDENKERANSNGRNYSVVGRYDDDDTKVGFKKETVHGVYDEKNMTDENLKTKIWYKIKYRQTVIEPDKKIKLEGWLDDEMIGEFIDDGNMTALEEKKGKPNKKAIDRLDPVLENDDKFALKGKMTKLNQVWTEGAYSGLYIRLTGTEKTFIKNLSVREI